jgi:hypothetical protein
MSGQRDRGPTGAQKDRPGTPDAPIVGAMLRKALVACGAISSLLYVAIDVIAAIAHPEYHSFTSRAVSELMARGAPTERLVDPLFLLYDVLILAFAGGLWMSLRSRRGRALAIVLAVYGALGFLGPTYFEMDMRGSSGTGDVAHIVLTAVMVALLLSAVVLGSTLRGRAFRVYSWATIAVAVACGALTSVASTAMAQGEPTPWMGLLERIDIGAMLLWIAVLGARLDAGEHGPLHHGVAGVEEAAGEGAHRAAVHPEKAGAYPHDQPGTHAVRP